LLLQQYQLATLRSTLTEAADKTTLNALQSGVSQAQETGYTLRYIYRIQPRL